MAFVDDHLRAPAAAFPPLPTPASPLPRLALVVSHPIQYYAPWFAYLSRHVRARIRVFYLWDFGVVSRRDPGFDLNLAWDIDLLEGYDHIFVPNRARDPGTHHFHGLRNPSLVSALAEWSPDVILLFGYRFKSHLQVITSPKLRRVPLLFRGDSHLLAERHGPLSLAVKRLSLRLLFPRFSAFLPVGRANADYFRRHGVPEGKMFPSPHAVDQARFLSAAAAATEEAAVWRRELEIPRHHRVILFAGKFERKKRPDDLLRAFLQVHLDDATLLFVGSGAMETDLRRMAGAHPHIRFAPFQNQSAMPRVYAAADLLVLPSCGPGESWGLVVNEALGAGKAVIVSDHVGCHLDLVQPGRNGLIFPAGHLDRLTDALREACRDPARLKVWGEEGKRIVARFGYREATEGLQRALDHVLKKGRVS